MAGPGVEAKVDRVRHYLRGAPSLTQSFVNGILRVEGHCPRFVAVACAVDIRVEVPAATPVLVRTERGTVSVDGMAGGVDVATTAGAVHLPRVTGTVKATTSAGTIDGVDLAPTALDAVTSGGDPCCDVVVPAPLADVIADAPKLSHGVVREGQRAQAAEQRASDNGNRLHHRTQNTYGRTNIGVAEHATERGRRPLFSRGEQLLGLGALPRLLHGGNHDRRIEHTERRGDQLARRLAETCTPGAEVRAAVVVQAERLIGIEDFGYEVHARGDGFGQVTEPASHA